MKNKKSEISEIEKFRVLWNFGVLEISDTFKFGSTEISKILNFEKFLKFENPDILGFGNFNFHPKFSEL